MHFQQRIALAACPTPTRTTRVTLEDTRKAIEDAKTRSTRREPGSLDVDVVVEVDILASMELVRT